jgi:hypothetical protein
VRHRLHVAEVVHGDDFMVGPAFEIGAEEAAADPPGAVDGDTRHPRATPI